MSDKTGKPWIKADNGRLTVDTSHPEWKKFFEKEVKRLTTVIKRIIKP